MQSCRACRWWAYITNDFAVNSGHLNSTSVSTDNIPATLLRPQPLKVAVGILLLSRTNRDVRYRLMATNFDLLVTTMRQSIHIWSTVIGELKKVVPVGFLFYHVRVTAYYSHPIWHLQFRTRVRLESVRYLRLKMIKSSNKMCLLFPTDWRKPLGKCPPSSSHTLVSSFWTPAVNINDTTHCKRVRKCLLKSVIAAYQKPHFQVIR